MRYFVHCTHPDGRTVGFAGLTDVEAEKTAASWGRDGYDCKVTSDAALYRTAVTTAQAASSPDADETPSEARLMMSRSRRLRQMARKAQRAWDRASKKLDEENARQHRLDMQAADAGADMLRDAAIARARATGETLS